ncbi:MAG TPA: NADH-quinone oxidoreductase subunit NuoF [Actinomycetota bacterium]|nr:NADH-quinone oxidoreductase subunit NuoF [Actinomycetota bacterium]
MSDTATATVQETKVVTARFDGDGSLDAYLASGGYEGLRKALAMSPADVIEAVKTAGLRGRGGAGFPTGLKWSFIPKDVRPSYIVCNADEGEPGTFKDRELMERDPHQLIEGMAIGAFAIGCTQMYIYVRGEFAHAARVLERAAREAYEKGYLGRNILGSDFDLDLIIHRGAGAYICGEETALLESLEGRRGQPRLRPPFPATHGLYGKPTVVNNVETFACVPHIMVQGPEWFRGIGTEKSPGTKMFSLSGDVERPGNYEVPFSTTARDLIEGLAGGVKDGRKLKAFTPGGASSTPFFGPDKLDVNMDWESVMAAGSLLGTGAMIVFAEDACMVRAALRYTRFYAHESCGKCTPCREGTYWIENTLRRFEEGGGREADLEIMVDVAGNIGGRSFCALGDFATAPVTSTVKLWRDEYMAHIKQKGCPFGR